MLASTTPPPYPRAPVHLDSMRKPENLTDFVRVDILGERNVSVCHDSLSESSFLLHLFAGLQLRSGLFAFWLHFRHLGKGKQRVGGQGIRDKANSWLTPCIYKIGEKTISRGKEGGGYSTQLFFRPPFFYSFFPRLK